MSKLITCDRKGCTSAVIVTSETTAPPRGWALLSVNVTLHITFGMRDRLGLHICPECVTKLNLEKVLLKSTMPENRQSLEEVFMDLLTDVVNEIVNEPDLN